MHRLLSIRAVQHQYHPVLTELGSKTVRYDHLLSRATERLARNLPEAAAAQLDLRRSTIAAAWNFPLNGQVGRQAVVREILAIGHFNRIIETGTYRGSTSAYLAHVSGLKIDTVELSPRFAIFAETVLRPVSQVRVHRADSRSFLTELGRTTSNDTRMFFYLDAHWNADVPRIAEVEIILETWKHAVIMIDDFKVRDDPGYGFTQYNGRELDLDYLPDLGDWSTFYPSIPSADETGARRGCLVIASPSLAQQIAELRSVRRT